MLNQSAVRGNVFQVPHKDQLEEYHRINALMTALTLVGRSGLVEKLPVRQIFQPAVEAGGGDPFRQTKLRQRLFLKVLVTLHGR